MSKFSRQQMRKAVEREMNRRQGVQEDVFTTMGLHLAMYALHRKFGFGKRRLERFYSGIQEIEAQANTGTADFSDERRQNVFHALYRIHQELDRIMGSNQFSEWFDKQKWIE